MRHPYTLLDHLRGICTDLDLPLPVIDEIDRRLRLECGGQRRRWYIHAPQNTTRNQRIREAWQAGESIAEIAETHGLTRDRVRRIVRRATTRET